MNHTWEISRTSSREVTNANGDSLENAIVKVKWKRVVTDNEGNKADYLGTTFFDLTEQNSSDFIAFSDVTSDTLIGWVQNSITSDELAKIDNTIAAKLLNRDAVETSWS
jgi:hypothetical protein